MNPTDARHAPLGRTMMKPTAALRALSGLLACAVVLAVAAPASAAAPLFAAPVDISTAGQSAVEPQIAVDGSGNTLAVWTRSNGTNTIVQSSFRPAGGAFGAPVDVSATGLNASKPQVAFDASGNALAVWRSSGAANIVSSFRSAAGSFAAPVDISAVGEAAAAPQVAFAPNGNAQIVYEGTSGANTIIRAATRGANGNIGVGVGISAGGQNSSAPQVAIDTSGNVLVVYRRFNGANHIVESSFKPAAGVYQANANLSAAGQNADAPQIAFDGSGNAVAVWTRYNGANNIIQSAFRPSGGPFQAPVDLSATGQSAFQPQVAANASGNVLAIWRRSNGTSTIVQSSSRPSGGSFAGPVDVSTAGQSAFEPQVALDASGNALAVWQRSDGADFRIQSAYRPAGGTFDAPADRSAAGQSAFEPQVAFDATGKAVAIWGRSNGANDIVQATVGVDPASPPPDASPSTPPAGPAPPAGPTPLATPPRSFTVLTTKADKRGVITLAVQAPGAGGVSAAATSSIPAKSSADTAASPRRKTLRYGAASVLAQSAGTVKLTIKPTAGARRQLKKAGRLKVAIALAFKPATGAGARTSSRATVRTTKAKPKR